MSGNNAVAVRRPARQPANMVRVRQTISGLPDVVRAELARREAQGTLAEHSGSRPHPERRGVVIVDAVVLEARPEVIVAATRRRRTLLLVSLVSAVLLAATVVLGYLAFVNTATALAGQAKGLLGCVAFSAVAMWAYGRRRQSRSGSGCGCGCTIVHICRTK
jgi:hypothetical protein